MSVSTPVVVNLQIPGTLSTSSAVAMAMPFSGKIAGAYMAVTTAPVGSALEATVLVGNDGAAFLSIAAGGNNDEATLTPTNVDFNKGDIVTVDVTAVGSGTAGANATVTLHLAAEADGVAVAIEPDNRFGQA